MNTGRGNVKPQAKVSARLSPRYKRDFPVIQGLRPHTPKPGGQGLIPGQGTSSHVLQLRVCMQELKIPRAARKMEDPEHGNHDPVHPSQLIKINILKNKAQDTR